MVISAQEAKNNLAKTDDYREAAESAASRCGILEESANIVSESIDSVSKKGARSVRVRLVLNRDHLRMIGVYADYNEHKNKMVVAIMSDRVKTPIDRFNSTGRLLHALGIKSFASIGKKQQADIVEGTWRLLMKGLPEIFKGQGFSVKRSWLFDRIKISW